MESSGIKRSLDHARDLSSHAVTGTLWRIGNPAFLEGAALVCGGYLLATYLPLSPLVRLTLLLAFLAFGSFWTTKRHKANHLQHSAIISAMVLAISILVMVFRGYDFLTIAGVCIATFIALFFGYRRAF